MSLSLDIVGCGAVVQLYHVPVLRQLCREGAVRVRHCVDPDAARADAVARVLGGMPCRAADLRHGIEAADAALVATPPESHREIASAYLQAGADVFVEKPFAASGADASELCRLVAGKGRRVLVGHFRRFYPSLQVARKAVAAGILGKVLRVEASDGARWCWKSASDYVVQSRFGGVALDTGSHLLDMVLFALSADSASGADFRLEKVLRKPETEPSHEVAADFCLSAGGRRELPVSIRVTRLSAIAGAVKIQGDAGMLVIPTAFSHQPMWQGNGVGIQLSANDLGCVPSDVMGCFEMEHRQLLEVRELGRGESLLDASRFILLTRMLESLVGAQTGAHA